MAFGALSVKGRALRYLSQREHGRVELARKLCRHLQDSETADAATQIAQTLDELASLGLLSEARAAASVLHSEGARFGERRLRQSLQSKGFAPELVASTLADARSSEDERALAVWCRKFGQPPQNAAERAKQMRFLLGRGFTAQVCGRLLRQQGTLGAGEPSTGRLTTELAEDTDEAL